MRANGAASESRALMRAIAKAEPDLGSVWCVGTAVGGGGRTFRDGGVVKRDNRVLRN